MRPPVCIQCALPVLELRGQMAFLDSYYVSGGTPPEEGAGWWHSRCLAGSPNAEAWYEARLRNHRDVRGYLAVGELDRWTIVRHPRTGEVLAFGRGGELLALPARRTGARSVEGGKVYPIVEEEHRFAIDDESIVQAIKDGLLSDGAYPLPTLVDRLGIADKVVHPEALERGLLRHSERLQRDWARRSVSARVEYGLFVPAELDPHVGRAAPSPG